MPATHCRFCAHDNPAGARFCTDCGSPLHLKPCPRCDAVNDEAAAHCFQCELPFGGPAVKELEEVAAAPMLAAAAAGGSHGGSGHPGRVLEALAQRIERDGAGAGIADTRRIANAPGRGADPPGGTIRNPAPAVRPRTGAAPRRWLALALGLLAAGIAGYAGYRHGAAPPPTPVPAARQAEPPPAIPEAPPEVGGAPAQPGAPPADAIPAADPDARPPVAAEGGGPPFAESRPRRPGAATAAAETNRIILRETGVVLSGPDQPPGAGATADRAAAATKRIIEREMGVPPAPR